MTNHMQQDFKYAIRGVRLISFFANEDLIRKPEDTVFSSMNAKIGFNLERGFVKLALRAWYHYDNDNTELAAAEVDNIFSVENLERYIDENNELNLPPQIWVNIVGVSISHTRALFSHSLAGTGYQDVVLAIMNPVETARAFFPKAFPSESRDENRQRLVEEPKEEQKPAKKRQRKEK